MSGLDVYFLALHEPYEGPDHPVPISATIVHARTLLHPAVPQPDGGLMYRGLTEFPGRDPGCVVPLSTLTNELAGGASWSTIGDWEAVVNAVVRLSRQGQCDAMPLGLPPVDAALLAQGPATTHTIYFVGAPPAQVDPAHREQKLGQITGHVRAFAAQGPFWPGDGLMKPPDRTSHPAVRPMEAHQCCAWPH